MRCAERDTPDASGEMSSRTWRPSQVSWSMGLGRTSPVAKPRGVWGWLGIRAESCLHSEERRDFKVAHAHCCVRVRRRRPRSQRAQFQGQVPSVIVLSTKGWPRMIEGWQGWREGGNPAVTHSSRCGGAKPHTKECQKAKSRDFEQQ